VTVTDITFQSAMIAVQGPKSIELMERLIKRSEWQEPLADTRYYSYESYEFGEREIFVSRTGYTGEDGIEIICDRDDTLEIWKTVMKEASGIDGMPAGLGARDTLRLEAAMPLYGHELSETINPIQAGLNFAVNLKDRKFIGSEALEKFAADKSQ